MDYRNIFITLVFIFFLVLCVYIFCITSHIFETPWWNWLWFICSAIMIIISFVENANAEISVKLNKNIETKANYKLVSLLLSALSINLIVIKVISANLNTIYIFESLLVFITIYGINKASIASLFVSMNVYLIYPLVQFGVWYETVIFAFIILLSIITLFMSYCIYGIEIINDKDKDDELKIPYGVNYVIVPLILILSFWLINKESPIEWYNDIINGKYLLCLFYVLLGLLLIISSNSIAIIVSSLSFICYFSFLSEWSNLKYTILSISPDLWFLIVDVIDSIWAFITNCAGSIWRFFKWKWFWIGLSTIVALLCTIYITALVVAKKVKNQFAPLKEKSTKPVIKPIIYRGRYMTCPKCRETMVEGAPANKTTRGTIKVATNATIGGISAAGCAEFGMALGSIVPGPGTIVGGVIGGLIGLAAGAYGSYKISNRINEKTEVVIDNVSYMFDGVKLCFKCPNCGHEWSKVEKDGEIIR